MNKIINDYRVWAMPLVKISDKHFHKDFYDVIIIKNLKNIDRYKRIFRSYLRKELARRNYKPIRKTFRYSIRTSGWGYTDELEMVITCLKKEATKAKPISKKVTRNR